MPPHSCSRMLIKLSFTPRLRARISHLLAALLTTSLSRSCIVGLESTSRGIEEGLAGTKGGTRRNRVTDQGMIQTTCMK